MQKHLITDSSVPGGQVHDVLCKSIMKYKYKGYEVSAAYSEEDDCIVCKVRKEAPSAVIFDVQEMDQVEAEFHLMIDSHLKLCEAKGIYPCP